MIYAVAIGVLGIVLDPHVRRFLGGGLLMLQSSGIALSASALVQMRSLRFAALATGQVHATPAYRYRSSAAQTAGLAVVFVWAFGLTADLAFLGAACLAMATALGYYRRSRRAAASPSLPPASPTPATPAAPTA